MVKDRTLPVFGRDLKVRHDELAVCLWKRLLCLRIVALTEALVTRPKHKRNVLYGTYVLFPGNVGSSCASSTLLVVHWSCQVI